jgi:hypothetical protein
MVKLNDVLAPTVMLAAPNAFEIVGGATTVMLALDVLLVAPPVVLAVTLLFLTPAVVPCTLAETVQLAPGPSVPADKLMEEDPAVAAAVPPQVLLRLGVGATTRPAGSESVNARPLKVVVVFELAMVNVRVVVPFRGMEAAPNALVIDGELMAETVAEAVPPVPPSVEVTGPVVLFLSPPVVAVTFTLKVQDALAARVAPVREIEPEPAVAVIVPPPQDPVRPFGVETTRPAGNVSVNPTPVSAVAVLGF